MCIYSDVRHQEYRTTGRNVTLCSPDSNDQFQWEVYVNLIGIELYPVPSDVNSTKGDCTNSGLI